MKLRKTERYASKEKKFFKKHPDLVNKFKYTVQKLENDPFESSLKLHKLQGNLEKFHAVRLAYELFTSFRATTRNPQNQWIPYPVLYDARTHDDVY